MTLTRNRITATLAVAGIAIMGAFTQPAVHAQQCKERCPEVGQEICCPGQSKADLEALGISITIESTTEGCFLVTSCNDPSCPTTAWEADLDIQHFKGEGSDPNLGHFIWLNDPKRTSDPATLRAYQKGEPFPALGTISFYAIAIFDKIPGEFRSEEQVRLINKEVHSFNPFKDELYVMDQSKPVVFINDETGDKFVLKELTSLLTP